MKSLFFISMFSVSAAFLAKTKSHKSFLKMADFTADIENIYRWKDQFPKEDYTVFLQELADHKVSSIFMNPSYTEMISKNNEIIHDPISQYHIIQANPLLMNKIVNTIVDAKIPIQFTELTNSFLSNFGLQQLYQAVSFTIPFLIIFYLLRIFFFKNNPMVNNMLQKPNISLESWIGSPEIKEECTDIIAYLDNKSKFQKIGAEMPRGILLEGPPGTGKTLLAKAIATETNAFFISISGSAFVELYVGMGAVKVRELFELARSNTPCILFIDEIDAVGKKRNIGVGMNEEREQTLNQLLYEMDGFNDNEDILVIAATNRKDVLDNALLRPGRFDRILKVPLPDSYSREKLIEFYLNHKPKQNIDVNAIAELTDGYSGAEIKNMINEAAILSVRNNYNQIQENYIYEVFERSVVGLLKKNATVNDRIRKRVSVHEAGHALLVLKHPTFFDLKKTSIQPTYNGAGGYTIFTEKPEIKEGGLYTKEVLKKRLVIAMGGKAAESLFFGKEGFSLGSIEDLKQANKLAKAMIRNYGMGEKLEVYYNDENPELIVSEQMKMYIDRESLKLVKDAYQDARRILLENKIEFIQLSNMFMNLTVIYGNPFSYNQTNIV